MDHVGFRSSHNLDKRFECRLGQTAQNQKPLLSSQITTRKLHIIITQREVKKC